MTQTAGVHPLHERVFTTPVLPVCDRTLEELEAELSAAGESPYRARQVYQGVFGRSMRDFSSLTDLPVPLRGRLQARYAVLSSRIAGRMVEREDGAVKYLVVLADGRSVEAVFLPHGRRNSLCVSTQAGCSYRCAFCATGRMGLVRNLTAGEIVEQALHVLDDARTGKVVITNMVFMGMGEPFANYEATVKALRILTDDRGLAFPPRRITVSTSGISPAIRRFAREGIRVRLAISLHATEDRLRAELVPHATAFPLRGLMAACRDYQAAVPSRPLTFEYVLLAGVNDSPLHARRLAKMVKGFHCLVDLIPYNPVPGLPYVRPARAAVLLFQQALHQGGALTRIRWSQGVGIQAACGQLVTTAGDRPVTPTRVTCT